MMEHDTAGNPIYRISYICDCGLTGGCKKCNPALWEYCTRCGKKMPPHIHEPNVMNEEIDKYRTHIREQIEISDNHVDEIDKRGREIFKLKAEVDRLKEIVRYAKNYVNLSRFDNRKG